MVLILLGSGTFDCNVVLIVLSLFIVMILYYDAVEPVKTFFGWMDSTRLWYLSFLKVLILEISGTFAKITISFFALWLIVDFCGFLDTFCTICCGLPSCQQAFEEFVCE